MARLLSGSSASVTAENVRSLKQQGLSEREALLRLSKSKSADPKPDAEPPGAEPETAAPSGRQFVVVTKDGSGLGWAKKLQEEGEDVVLVLECDEPDPEDKEVASLIGEGWFARMPLAQAMTTYTRDTDYWIFAENNFPKEADTLRTKACKVFGTSALSERMEHDRPYAVEIAEQSGLISPETHEFTSRAEGLSFLAANPDTAYVFKPDDSGGSNYSTFVPIRVEDADANQETTAYLQHMKEEPGSYILQARVAGTEIDLELWMYDGEPCFAMATLEAKRKNAGDLGEMAGCSGDFVWVVPVDSPLIAYTIGKMRPFYKQERYTGFVDANVILTASGPLFLEVCNRLGYNSHVTLFLGLATDTVGNILTDFMDGRIANLESRFRPEIGSSVTIFLDHPRAGLPLHLDPRWEAQFYPFDGYKEDDTLLLTGYSSEIGIFTDHGTTIEEAAKAMLDKVMQQEAVSVPDMHYRMDLGLRGYPNACLTRYDALNDQWGHSMRVVGGQARGR